MSTQIIDRRGMCVLGKQERAEQLVTWSQKHKRGQRYVKDTPFGLRLGFVSDGDTPKIYLHWNQQKFWKFFDEVGKPECFVFISWGVAVTCKQGRTIVRLVGADKVLWDSEKNSFAKLHSERNKDDEVNWMLGMIRLGYDGPVYHEQHECQEELEQATALAVIRVEKEEKKAIEQKTKQISEVLPDNHKVSDKARAYLAKDLLLNILLSKRAKGGEGVGV